MKTRRCIIILALALIVLSVGPLLFWFYNSPLKDRYTDSKFIVNNGDSVLAVAKRLKKQGFIRSDRFFVALVKFRRLTGEIKAGEYRVGPYSRTTKIIDLLTKGAVVTIKFTVPEGLHIGQIAVLLERNGILGADEFVRASKHLSILKKFGIPFTSAEGFLFPDTYIVAKGLSAEQIVTIMIERFFEEIVKIPLRDYTENELRRVIIIASLVEREAKIDSEREMIAAVFYNRLMNNKRLESCATVQYILGKTKERLLHSDLKVDSPYNTYLHKGLPPGPISNPGIKSIRAALFPAEVDYLFFVSKRDGSHHFSSTYEEHLEAIERYNKSGKIGHQIS